MHRTRILVAAAVATLAGATGCAPTLRPPAALARPAAALPAAYDSAAAPTADAPGAAATAWRRFFAEPELTRLVDAALAGNQELRIVEQEIEIARQEARARSGEYLPSVGVRAGAGVEKAARYTREGAVEHGLEVKPGTEFPEPLRDFRIAGELSWEVDIWHRLRDGTKAATLRYLATAEGRDFMTVTLVAEVARTYYELAALDARRALIEETIGVQAKALDVVRLQKQSGRATELAVRRFEAEVLKNLTRLAETVQAITATQNRLNVLVGRYPGPIARTVAAFEGPAPAPVAPGSPAELLTRRPDVRRAELELAATGLDVRAARARFRPSLGIEGAVGLRSFELGTLATTPASLLYGLGADLSAPLFNRRAIDAAYRTADARQRQALSDYQRTLLGAYTEVATQLARIRNLDSSYAAKARQVEALRESIRLAEQLFRSARGDYLEVLLTQREALESRIELVELRQQQLDARVSAYKALGGGAPEPGSQAGAPRS